MAESIVGAMVNFVGEKLLQCMAEPIKRWYNYLRQFDSNIQKLRNEARNLENARSGLQMRVDTARSNAEVILAEINTWFEDVYDIQAKMTRIESEITNVQSGCFAIKSRLTLSKQVENTTEAMKELQGRCCNFNVTSQPAPPAATALFPLGSTFDFESRKDIEEDIVKALREFDMVGICGMGGVGKTTIAKRIENRVKKEGLIDESVKIVVSQRTSQQVEELRIQNEIAEQLSLKLEGESLLSRAHKLRTRLQGGKKILIILDDIWEKVKLEDLGIPCEIGLKGCKILLTSRDRSVLNKMDAQRVCEIRTLSAEEALSLFKEKVGTCMDDQSLHSIAQEIVKECKGLPIALVTVGTALKGQRDKSVWKGVLDQLKSSNPEDVPDIIAEVYNPLKLSYDFLDSQHAKSIFLLCCLFPEDYDIPLEYLTVYAMGLGMFKRNMNLERARNNTCLVVDMLKSHFLLLEGRTKGHVKMHDVVRDVSIFVASKERRIKCSGCTWISPFHRERLELSTESSFPNLRLLLIDISTQVNDNFFEEMRELNVLSVRHHSLRSLPHTAQLLKGLRTLILVECFTLETIFVVGELVNLEILICRDCGSIKELQVEIGGLNRLRLLELSYCWKLKTIAPGVISRLNSLEELKMMKSFDKWETEYNKGKERKNAGIKELESLTNLTCLEIEVEDSSLVAEQIRLSPKIVKFDITIGDCRCYKSDRGSQSKMDLHLPREIITLGNWILKFFSSAENMRLAAEGLSNLQLEKALQNLRSLTLSRCSMVKKLVNITSLINDGRHSTTANAVFPVLKSLVLDSLPNLKEICDIDGPIPDEGSGSKSFKNLRILRLKCLPALKHLWKNSYQNIVSLCNLSSVSIRECHSLRNLFSGVMVNDCLLQLTRLEIIDCKMMEQVFLWNEKEENKKDIGEERRHIITFPKLKFLGLGNLPNLTSFYKGIESIEFPLLTEIEIRECPQLKSLASPTSNSQNNLGGTNPDHDDEESLHLFCKPDKVAFGSLKKLCIDGCNNSVLLWCHLIPISFFTRLEGLKIANCNKIKRLFPSSITGSLVNLKILHIESCEEMVEVIEDDKDKDACQTMICLFPRLQYLDLWSLSKLEIFCNWRCALQLPCLKDVVIFKCPEMERFSFGSLTTPNLEKIRWMSRKMADFWERLLLPENIINSKDLNDAVQLYYLLRVKKEEERMKKREQEKKEERRAEEEGGGGERKGTEKKR